MVYVVVLSSFEVLLPIIIFVAIGIEAGVESGAIQNAAMEWFSYWVFTPSFFITLLPFALMALCIFISINLKLCDLFNLDVKIDFLWNFKEKWDDTLAARILIIALLVLFAVMFAFFGILNNIIMQNEWGLEWLWNNSRYSWLHN